MDRIIEAKREQLAGLCIKHRVSRLELFGSAANGEFDAAKSDLDFLVQFREMAPAAHADCYFGLLECLEALFNRHVDLVEAGAVHNPYFLKTVERNLVVLYAA